MSKIKWAVIICVMTIALCLCSASAVSTDEDAVNGTVNEFFSLYMDSLVSKEHTDITSVAVVNTNTALYKAAMDYEVDSSILFSCGYNSYSLSLDVQTLNIDETTATVELVARADIQFEGLETMSKQSSSYKFCLEKIDGSWKITNIDTSNMLLKNYVNNIKLTRSSSVADIERQADALTAEWLGNLEEINDEDIQIIRGGDATSAESQRKAADRVLAETAPEPRAATSVTYDYYNAVAYADQYSETGSSYDAFYIADEDCTNFVSQCVWAGYGGWTEGESIAQMKDKTAAYYRMYFVKPISYTSGWYPGTSSWENVVGHWDFVTQAHTYGPKGTGYNNEKLYTNLSAGEIYVGETLEVRNGSSGRYGHAVFVTHIERPSSGGMTYSNILINAHNEDRYQYPLSKVIAAHGGTSCYMRDIVYGTATFP